MKDPEIQQSVLDALAESTIGLCGEYGFTREEMAAMLARFCQATGRQLEPVQSPTRFTDQRSIHPWALEAVAAMQQAGVLQGDTQGRFSPQAPATRAETAITLQRLVEAVLASSTH